MSVNTQEICLRGVPICRGIAIGKPFFFTLKEEEIPEVTIAQHNVDGEVSRYIRAVSRSKKDVKRLQKKLKGEKIAEGVAILDTYLQMMQDPLLTTEIEREIRNTRKNAEFVFQSFISQCQKKFQSFDPFFRERFKDIQDVSKRVMGYLRESDRITIGDIPADSIVFSRELSASEAAEANVSNISAFVTAYGGATSHAAIVAKAKGIPYVTDVSYDRISPLIDPTLLVVVDGRVGDVIFNPDSETLATYRRLQSQLELQLSELSKSKFLEAQTLDGYDVKLSANIDMVDELDTFHKYGGHGVGLFRSEYIFLSNDTFPTEEDQFVLYQRIVKKMNGLPIVIRTFDFGGDKLILKQPMAVDGNPFLGCRAIRYLLKERDIFKAQIRAILRASAFGEVSLMFPMISALTELLEAKDIVKEAREELRKRGEHTADKIRIGSMIEVPSAVIIADLLAKECDFLSIGTNDLVQYSLAVDRRNHSTSGFYAATDPSVVRMIKQVVCEANHHGIPVTVCGEVAADPRFTPLLLGLGVHELSVAARYIPVIKQAVRGTSIVDATFLAEKVLSLTNARDILDVLTHEYQQTAPADQFYNY
ncbi:MAG TPA: phosphoenolpyruvate--protein phosphotransferase [Waddliaceae bacterium]